MSHTPGPWRVATMDQSEHKTMSDFRVPIMAVENSNGFQPVVGWVETRSARLIAAAPDLLEVARNISACNLEPCAPCICEYHAWAGGGDYHGPKCEVLRDAVKKAIG